VSTAVPPDPLDPPEGDGGQSFDPPPELDLDVERPAEGIGEETFAPPPPAEVRASRPGSLPEWWTGSYPQVADVSSATAYLDGLGGSLSRERRADDRWVLFTGAQVLFEADTPEELDGFVLGFALSQLIADRHGPISQAQRQSGA
jgi:hypothetical protein